MRPASWKAVFSEASSFARRGVAGWLRSSWAKSASVASQTQTHFPHFSRSSMDTPPPPRSCRPAAELCHLAAEMSVSRMGHLRSGPPFAPPQPSAPSPIQDSLESEIRAGLARAEFVPYYQPIVSLQSGAVVGFESLARWRHPTRGLLQPSAFIRQTEDSGLIDELSLMLLERACGDMAAWPAHLTLSINVSPVQLRRSWLAPTILKILWSSGIAPGRLIVELTESRGIADFVRARQVIESLKRVGIKVALDDFGAGHASLLRLRELEFDRLKIDRAFTGELGRPENFAILRAMLSLGEGLGIAVVAEGVETPCTADRLVGLGCAYAQGFLYSPPVSAEAALELIASPGRPLQQGVRRAQQR